MACSTDDDPNRDGTGAGGGGNGNNQDPTAGQPSTANLSADARAFVDAHNAIRAQVTEPGGYQGTWQSVPPVTWSETVASSAQAWADHLKDAGNCELGHDPSSPYGENLAWGSAGLTPQQAVSMWEEEKQNYVYSSSYDPNTGHYTQIVWRNTREIGCGSATCDGGATVICCRYNPRGNMVGDPPY